MEHFEDLLHERFGETDYWDSRYSMVYAAHLREAGRRFMAERLGYEVPEGGRGREQAKDGGGDYLSVHLRRFVLSDSNTTHCDVDISLSVDRTTCMPTEEWSPHWRELPVSSTY